MANAIGAHHKELINLIKQAAYKKSIYQVFNDFLEMSAIAISNQTNFLHREKRETRYLEIINSYDKKHQQLFPLMLFHLVEALEEKTRVTGPEDVLGCIFHELELHNEYKAQFFTPQHISDAMAQMICGDKSQKAIEENGFIHVCEPAAGSGVMVTSFCKAMQQASLNYCSQLVVTAVDIDLSCTHMAYLQLSLYGVPAVVIHGNTLTCEEWSRWYTPVYLLDNWIWRAHCGITQKTCIDDEMIKCASEPMYAAFREIERLFPKKAPENVESSEASTEENEKPLEVFTIKHLSFFDDDE